MSMYTCVREYYTSITILSKSFSYFINDIDFKTEMQSG